MNTNPNEETAQNAQNENQTENLSVKTDAEKIDAAANEMRELAEQDARDGFDSIKQRLDAEKSNDQKVSDTSDTFDDEDAGASDFFAGLDAADDDDPLFDETAELPAYDFAAPPFVKLKDGSEFYFKIPDGQSEARADNLRKTLIITSPAKVNGFNPTQETTDYATADVRYFLDNLLQFKGFALNSGDDANAMIDAKTVIRTEKTPAGKTRTITAAHLVPVKHQRAAAARIYGGKIEVKKSDNAEKRVKVLNETRFIIVRQEFGVEQNDDGTFTRPTHIVEYTFREPTAKDLTFWQTKCFLGYKIPIKGGGSREERFFNTDRTIELFDNLLHSISGATIGGAAIGTGNMKDIPVGVKRNAVTLCMGEVAGDVGNS